MRFATPQLAWSFDIEPIHSVDFHPRRAELLVGGADSSGEGVFLRTWDFKPGKLFSDEGQDVAAEPRWESRLGHSKSVNCARFSPSGLCFASGGDDAHLLVWEERATPKAFGSAETVQGWAQTRSLAGHSKEVYHLDWLRDERYLVSGSHDFSVIVWEVRKGRMLQRFDGPTGYVKSVVADPLGKYFLAFSCDRTLRIFKAMKQKKLGFNIKHAIRRFSQTESLEEFSDREENPRDDKEDLHSLHSGAERDPKAADLCFVPDSVDESMFIRADWSPDGSLFLVPRAQFRPEPPVPAPQASPLVAPQPILYGVHLFTRENLTCPALFYPCDRPVNLVRFCPIIFWAGEEKLFDSPFMFLFAVASYNALTLYSTTSIAPLFRLQNIHYARISDLAWLGYSLVACSSMDGYITFASLEAKLDDRIVKEEDLPPDLQLARKIEVPEPKPVFPQGDNVQKIIFKNGKKTIIPKMIGS